MRILIAVHHFPPRYIGGAEWESYRLARALQERGHTVQVVCVERIDAGPADGVAWTDDCYDGIAVRRLSFDLRAAPDRWRWEYDNPWIGEHVRELMATFRPQLFNLIGGYLMSASVLRVARESGIPVAVRPTDFWFLCPRITMLRSDGSLSTLPIDAATCARCLGEESRRYRILGRLAPQLMSALWRQRRQAVERVETRLAVLREALQGATVVVSPSHFMTDMIVAGGLDPRRIRLVEKGLPSQTVSTRSNSATAGRAPTPLQIGYIGQIIPIKGVDVLLRAVRQLPGVALTLRVYGDPTRAPAYANDLRQLSSDDRRVAFPGPLDRREVNEVLQALDVLVVPSIWHENAPTVILEAFSNRVPVLASDVGGMTELVHHERNGLVFSRGDPTSLAQQLRRLVDEPHLLDTLRSGIAPVGSHTEEIDQMERIFLEMVARRAEAAS
jgi:glycosyltransferase involved in cell wall biosynthesis